MSALNDLGWQLIVANKPNVDGLSLFKIVDECGEEVAEIDRPCTVEEAFAAARRFAEMELQNDEE